MSTAMTTLVMGLAFILASVIVYPTAGRKSRGVAVSHEARVLYLMHRPLFVLFFWGGMLLAAAGGVLVLVG